MLPEYIVEASGNLRNILQPSLAKKTRLRTTEKWGFGLEGEIKPKPHKRHITISLAEERRLLNPLRTAGRWVYEFSNEL